MPTPKVLTLVLVAALAAGCAKSAKTPPDAGGAASGANASGAAGTAAVQPGAARDQGASAAAAAAKPGSPTQAYYRMVDAVDAKDWGAFYDAMGPKVRAIDAADPAHADLDASLSPRDKFIAGMEKTMADLGSPTMDGIGPEAFLAIWQGTTVKSEAIAGDQATLTITKDGKDWQEVFVKEDGKWKFDGAE